jgi:hypothetical protein
VCSHWRYRVGLLSCRARLLAASSQATQCKARKETNVVSAHKHHLGLPHWLEAARASCDVCGSHLHPHAYYLEEEVDVPGPRQSWTLCPVCTDAIERRLTQAPLQAPHRVRVAVGLVASERVGPHAVSERRPAAESDRLADRRIERLLIAFFLLCFAVHALVFILLVLAIALR